MVAWCVKFNVQSFYILPTEFWQYAQENLLCNFVVQTSISLAFFDNDYEFVISKGSKGYQEIMFENKSIKFVSAINI